MSSGTEDPSPITQRKGKDDASFENVRGGGVRGDSGCGRADVRDGGDKVEPKAKSAGKDAQAEISDWSLTAKTKIALKNELTDNVAGREGSRLSTTGSRAQVMAMQQALKDKGFDPGPIDGTLGPRTAAALSSYQKAENPALTDRMNPLPALLMRGILFGDRHFPP